MGLWDKLSSYVDDAGDWVEDQIDDAGEWIEETVDDIAGENSWASKLVDKAGDALGGDEFADQLWSRVRDYAGDSIAGDGMDLAENLRAGDGDAAMATLGGAVGEHTAGTWAEDEVAWIRETVDGGIGGIATDLKGWIDDEAGDTWLGDLAGKADGLTGGKLGDLWDDDEKIAKAVDGGVEDLVGDHVVGDVAGDLATAVSATGGDGADDGTTTTGANGAGAAPSAEDTTSEASATTGATEAAAAPTATTNDAGPAIEIDGMTPTTLPVEAIAPVAVETAPEPVVTPDPVATPEPVVTPDPVVAEPEPVIAAEPDFAAADQVEESVEDIFDGIG